MNLQQVYWTVCVIAALVATVLNVVMFFRSKPDRIKAAVQSAIAPIREEVEELKQTTRDQGEQLNEQDRKLAGIEAELKHMPSKQDLGNIHHRITELVRSTSTISGLQDALGKQLDRVNQFLLENPRGR